MKMRIVFSVVSFRNLCCLNGWLDKAYYNAETRSYIDGEVNRINYANNQDSQLEKVVNLIAEYTTKDDDFAEKLVQNCTQIIVEKC